MTDPSVVAAAVAKAIENTDAFVVDITVSPDNDIVVELDSPTGVDLDFCAEASRAIEAALDRDAEDFSLEVGSASLTAPFRVKQQYDKHLGDRIEVVLNDDPHKLRGTLERVGDEDFDLAVTSKVKEPGMKRPEVRTQVLTIPYGRVRTASYLIEF